MKKSIKWLLVVSIIIQIAMFAGCGENAKDTGTQMTLMPKPAAVVNGEPISMKSLQVECVKYYGPQVLQNMINEKLVEQAAKKENITVSKEEVDKEMDALKKDPQFEMMLRMQGKTLQDIEPQVKTAITLRKLTIKNDKITQQQEKEYFDKHKDELIKVKASHILVKDQATADKIYKELESGKSFEELAKANSTCGSKEKGGDLGFFTMKTMDPTFTKVAFSLKIGELSKPFKTKFGWHIVKVTEKMDTFDQLIPEIEQALINKDSMRKYFEQLKKEAKITNNIVKEESSEEAVTTEKSAEGKK